MPVRPTLASMGLDSRRDAEFRAVPEPPIPRTTGGGFGTGLLVAGVFVVVAIIAAAVFSNRDMFGIGLGVTPASSPAVTTPAVTTPAVTTPAVTEPMETTIAPVAPTPAPAPEEPATPPAEAPVGPAPTVNP
jgi:hypothetical protein